jgi:hypothetical protein
MRDPIHTTECEVIYTHAYVHANISNTNTRAWLARIPTLISVHNAIVHSTHKCMHSCEEAMYCNHLSVWSVELWASPAAMCCAPSAPMELLEMLYAHICVRRPIQRTCVDHNARSHTYNRVRGHIHPCIRACRHIKYKHACMACTYTYPCSNAQRNST